MICGCREVKFLLFAYVNNLLGFVFLFFFFFSKRVIFLQKTVGESKWVQWSADCCPIDLIVCFPPSTACSRAYDQPLTVLTACMPIQNAMNQV